MAAEVLTALIWGLKFHFLATSSLFRQQAYTTWAILFGQQGATFWAWQLLLYFFICIVYKMTRRRDSKGRFVKGCSYTRNLKTGRCRSKKESERMIKKMYAKLSPNSKEKLNAYRIKIRSNKQKELLSFKTKDMFGKHASTQPQKHLTTTRL